ncbi:WD40 repeat domain-containing protein [Sulfurimonas sp.]|uniref:WD40 repeat domain-containing protein n=1 Tax=Sulfurimonas sp. TaxID=2022749 RepID=UPI0025FAB6E5|nr:WD40 repeat domain-containing protein [Sulfurimonas sp.]MBW6488120.1 WD40 repeat domain-containing protein [Sulfurimonas sp.]
MKPFILLTLLVGFLFGADIKEPKASFISSGSVIDILYQDGRLYSATDAGCVDIFDFKSRAILKKIEVPKIEDFMGDEIDSKVYSVDKINTKIMILSQGRDGFRRVHINQDGKTQLLIDYSKALTIAKAKFLNENTILLALLSNELISYDIKKRTNNWLIQVSGAKFSDFVLNESKDEVVIADESGNLKIHSTKDGKLLKTLAGENLDNVFQVDYKNGVIATAGQDRRVVIYAPKTGSAYQIKSDFLVYSVGLSPSGAIVGYASDENNNVTLLNSVTKSKIARFGKNKMTLNRIVFINENEFLVASDDKTINLYSVE